MENSKALVSPPADAPAPAEDDNSFASILSAFEQQHQGNGHSQAVHGTVLSIGPENIIVDIGRKMDGLLTLDTVRDASGSLTVKPGDSILVSITGRDEEGSYLLSTIRVERPKDWSGFEKAYAEKRTIGGTVTESVKGGFRVDVGVSAFLPASRCGVRDQAEMEKLVGQQIEVKIIKVDVAGEDVVVDRRAVLDERASQAKQEAFSQLHEGAVVRGTVRSLTDFGAFVELSPGVDGLLHVADMSWVRISKPSDVVKAGDSLEVKILKLNRDSRRISLGLKQLIPDPWTLAGERFHVGERVHGKVSRLTDFGAFVELAPGVDGLIHVSEMSWSKKVRKPSDVVKPGDLVEAVVLGVNAAEHRISLGLKQALGDPWEEAEKKFAPGTVVEGAITSLQPFGAFVDLGNGVEGMIHIGDISRDKRLNHPREVLSANQTVKAVVLEQDKERRRLRLGMKQLEPTSVDHYIAEHQVGEVVTGRVVDVSGSRVKAELGEGVFAICRLQPAEPAERKEAKKDPSRADVSSMSAMLAARWKQGAAGAETSQGGRDQVKAGQVRSFKIAGMDASKKTIDVELG
ncbi:MAG: 30S ribosomal protein S1 [Acidobacteriaceae bacterium]|nr:30S ribosomal protein S1 [Acidobacteriaceae bacterium]